MTCASQVFWLISSWLLASSQSESKTSNGDLINVSKKLRNLTEQRGTDISQSHWTILPLGGYRGVLLVTVAFPLTPTIEESLKAMVSSALRKTPVTQDLRNVENTVAKSETAVKVAKSESAVKVAKSESAVKVAKSESEVKVANSGTDSLWARSQYRGIQHELEKLLAEKEQEPVRSQSIFGDSLQPMKRGYYNADLQDVEEWVDKHGPRGLD